MILSRRSARYIELYEKLTGKIFQKNGEQDILNRIEVNLKSFLVIGTVLFPNLRSAYN